MQIAVIATGVGNVRSVVRALDRAVAVSKDIIVTADPDAVRRADAVVVPGQGSFGAFAQAMSTGLADVLRERILSGTPYLGICLGLQILFEQSEEAPGSLGLGVFRGRVRRLTPGSDAGTLRPLPHMGWNRAEPASDVRSRALVPSSHYYFAHTYAVAPLEPNLTASTTEYGETFTSAVHRDNVLGVQFHPEKSQRAGLALLAGFFSTLVGAGGTVGSP